MKQALFPGSFNPFTIGHHNIIEKAAQLFDVIHVVQFVNPEKNGARNSTLHNYNDEIIDNCKVIYEPDIVTNLYTTDWCFKNGVKYMIRGIRTPNDFQYEEKLYIANKNRLPDIETVLFIADVTQRDISSSYVRKLLLTNPREAQKYIYHQ